MKKTGIAPSLNLCLQYSLFCYIINLKRGITVAGNLGSGLPQVLVAPAVFYFVFRVTGT